MQPQSNLSPETPNEPRVSVVIVSWNCVDDLRRCVVALNASRRRDQIEVLVVDAGSRDGCGQLDGEFSNVTVHRLPRNFGKTRARNIGIRAAHAELILLLDPEVEVTAETVMALAGALDSDAQAVAALPRLVDETGLPAPIGSRLPDRAALATACRANSGLPLGPQEAVVELGSDVALMVRKSFLRGMNFLDEKRYSEYWSELELFWRIQSGGKRAVIAGEPATLHAPRFSVAIPRAEHALLASDRVAGAAAFIAKREGAGAKISFLFGQFFSALGSALRQPGYGLRLAFGILTGSRIDGTQSGELA